MKTYGGVEIWLQTFVISVQDGGEWSAAHSNCFTPRERIPALTEEDVGGTL
jgi:hypothetical protein